MEPIPPESPRLDHDIIHALSNQLAVILGLVELVLADTPPSDARHADLQEIRTAALEAAKIIGKGD